jgi:hypothetical protein
MNISLQRLSISLDSMPAGIALTVLIGLPAGSPGSHPLWPSLRYCAQSASRHGSIGPVFLRPIFLIATFTAQLRGYPIRPHRWAPGSVSLWGYSLARSVGNSDPRISFDHL